MREQLPDHGPINASFDVPTGSVTAMWNRDHYDVTVKVLRHTPHVFSFGRAVERWAEVEGLVENVRRGVASVDSARDAFTGELEAAHAALEQVRGQQKEAIARAASAFRGRFPEARDGDDAR